MARLFVTSDPTREGCARLDAAGARHLRALRLKPGDEITAILGPARQHRARIEAIERSGATVVLGESIEAARADPRRPCILAVGLGDLARMDLVVEKATELGATGIQPFVAARSQVNQVSQARLARWRRIALAASEQCGRSVPPEVCSPIPFEQLRSACAAGGTVLLFTPSATARPVSALGPSAEAAERGFTLVIGPEGGLTDAEIARLSENALSVKLGGRTLRFETAAIAALAALVALFPED
jgi:16S rRNA (uracil1498-N3)-methyltransferase